jgi:predicted MPP superfamily phosphohydrolase
MILPKTKNILDKLLVTTIKNNNKLQYLSDIHLEYKKDIPIPNVKGKYIALCGDIGSPLKRSYFEFINNCSYNYEKVFLLSGNHEYWNHKGIPYYIIDLVIDDIASKFSNVIYLNNMRYYIEGYNILGTTLWSNITKEPSIIKGDEKHIYKDNNTLIDWTYINKIHNDNVKWLETELDIIKKNNNKAIVLSHHLPSYQLVLPEYRTVDYINYLDRYYSNLDYLISNPPIYAWLCGHTHSVYDMYINNVFFGINSFGYSNKHIEDRNITLY